MPAGVGGARAGVAVAAVAGVLATAGGVVAVAPLLGGDGDVDVLAPPGPAPTADVPAGTPSPVDPSLALLDPAALGAGWEVDDDGGVLFCGDLGEDLPGAVVRTYALPGAAAPAAAVQVAGPGVGPAPDLVEGLSCAASDDGPYRDLGTTETGAAALGAAGERLPPASRSVVTEGDVGVPGDDGAHRAVAATSQVAGAWSLLVVRVADPARLASVEDLGLALGSATCRAAGTCGPRGAATDATPPPGAGPAVAPPLLDLAADGPWVPLSSTAPPDVGDGRRAGDVRRRRPRLGAGVGGDGLRLRHLLRPAGRAGARLTAGGGAGGGTGSSAGTRARGRRRSSRPRRRWPCRPGSGWR